MKAVFDVFKQFKRKNIVLELNRNQDQKVDENEVDIRSNIEENSVSWVLLGKKPEYIGDLSFEGKETKIPIFFMNPEKNWGPGRRAT